MKKDSPSGNKIPPFRGGSRTDDLPHGRFGSLLLNGRVKNARMQGSLKRQKLGSYEVKKFGEE
jgi:hypothetical protein